MRRYNPSEKRFERVSDRKWQVVRKASERAISYNQRSRHQLLSHRCGPNRANIIIVCFHPCWQHSSPSPNSCSLLVGSTFNTCLNPILLILSSLVKLLLLWHLPSADLYWLFPPPHPMYVSHSTKYALSTNTLNRFQSKVAFGTLE